VDRADELEVGDRALLASVRPISHRKGAASLSNATDRGASPTGRDEAHRKLISMDCDMPASPIISA
jgi:hypothetical protein